MTILYIIRSNTGLVSQGFDLAKVILEAAQYDGYAAEYVNDSEQGLVLLSSHKHVDNAGYDLSQVSNWRGVSSSLADLEQAKQDIAKQLWHTNIIHNKYNMDCFELRFDESGDCQTINNIYTPTEIEEIFDMRFSEWLTWVMT